MNGSLGTEQAPSTGYAEQDVSRQLTADGLPANSYTAHQLQHATAEHLHITTRRCFIGPIPEEWLSRHRKSWYRYRPSFARYSSRTATFLAGDNVSHTKSVTGLEGRTWASRQSFPQPADLAELEQEEARHDGGPAQNGPLSPTTLDQPDESAADPLALPVPPRRSSLGKMDRPANAKYTGNAGGRKEQSETGTSSSSSWWRRSSLRNRPSINRKDSSKSAGSSSFVTAAESIDDSHSDDEHQAFDRTGNEESPPQQSRDGFDPSQRSSLAISPQQSHVPESVSSTSGLLAHAGDAGNGQEQGVQRVSELTTGDNSNLIQSNVPLTKSAIKRPGKFGPVPSTDTRVSSSAAPHNEAGELQALAPVATTLVRFKEPQDQRGLKADHFVAEGDNRSRSFKKYVRRRSSLEAGQMVKAERMLVRVDDTVHDLGDDFDENSYFAKEARAVSKWREFVVVCRESVEGSGIYSIRMYKSRVIPFVESRKDSKKHLHEIELRRKDVHVNLFSSLDKTIVIWTPSRKSTRIYILKPQSSSDAVQWYSFLRQCLGWRRPPLLTVGVPELDVKLTLDNPFVPKTIEHQNEAQDKHVHFSSELQDEGGVARAIILQCLKLLADSPVSHITEVWRDHKDRLGLAWRRYDRLEWISRVDEQNMYGAMAMQVSHELEILPKRHYPTTSKSQRTPTTKLEEPPAIEGFLVRMTSQKGRHSRVGKNFYKKLYFYTNNHLLCSCQPSKAIPPKPPKLLAKRDHNTPKAKEIAGQIPLIFAVNPYPLDNGKIVWLSDSANAEKAEYDHRAYEEAERRTNLLLESEAYINLTHVVAVRKVLASNPAPLGQSGGEQPDHNLLTSEAEVDTDLDEDNRDETQADAQARSFELVLKNGLTVRLQAYSRIARKEWVLRLRGLITYWKSRTSEDSRLLKLVRHENLERLQIDEEQEAIIGQYARKWEVRRSVASSELWNMCGIACCRTMSMYGVLYRKPRMHGTFKRCNVILAHGKILLFQSALRTMSGKVLPHVHHERQEVIELEDTYVYSGLITDTDLLYQNQTFSPEHPGHAATPCIYLEDGWTSSDEDTMTCFCLWRSKRKSLFRGLVADASDDGQIRHRLRYVSSLGVPGRTMVFKTRSRAERDRWVLSIGLEIERLKRGELATKSDIRVTGAVTAVATAGA